MCLKLDVQESKIQILYLEVLLQAKAGLLQLKAASIENVQNVPKKIHKI